MVANTYVDIQHTPPPPTDRNITIQQATEHDTGLRNHHQIANYGN